MIKKRIRNVKDEKKNVRITGRHDIFIFIREYMHAKILGKTCCVMKIMEK